MSSRHLLLSLLLLPLPSLVAHADPSPVGCAFQIETVVANDCAFGTTINDNACDLSTLSFGALNNLTSPVNVANSSETGSITLACTPGMTVSVALDYGVNNDSSNQHHLKWVNGNKTPAYQFYQGTAYFQVWDDGALTRTIANFPVSTQAYTVCARLFAVGSLLSAGNHRNTVTVTLSF